MKIGVYKITSPTGKIYIGQSINCELRKRSYKNGNFKQQTKLYHSVQKHGWDSHKFEIVHQCNIEQLNELEKYYIQLFNTFESEHGLNLQNGGHRGLQSEETRRRISASNMGKKMSEETKFKMRINGKGKNTGKKRPPFTKEHKENLSKALSGRKMPESFRIIKSKQMMGNKMSDEAKAKSIAFHTGRKRSPETCMRISEGQRGRKAPNKGIPHSEETKNKMRGRKNSEAAKLKMSESAIKRHQNNKQLSHDI